MYNSIDITNNKILYNFSKLNKLASQKDLLYSCILIYYILYNKLNNMKNKLSIKKNTTKQLKQDSKIDKLVSDDIYHKQQQKLNNMYLELHQKIDKIDAKVSQNPLISNYNTKTDLLRQDLNEGLNSSIDTYNSNIDKSNQQIEEYNIIAQEKRELQSHIEYLNTIIENFKNKDDVDEDLINTYKKKLNEKNKLLLSLTERINELNDILKKYLINNTEFENIEILNNQIDTYKLYIENIEKKLKNLENLVKELKSKKSDNDSEDDLQKNLSTLKNEILELERKKIKLDYDIKLFTQKKQNLLMDNTTTEFAESLTTIKKDIEESNIKLLHKLQKNKIETDLSAKLEEKFKIETEISELLEELTIDTSKIYEFIDECISINNVNNSIINNINKNIKKINETSNIDEKNRLRLINENLKLSLEENDITIIISKLIDFLDENNINKLSKQNLLKLIFIILHIDTEINILNNVTDCDTNIEKQCQSNLSNLDYINKELADYKSQLKSVENDYKNNIEFINKLQQKSDLTEDDLKNVKKLIKKTEEKKIFLPDYKKLLTTKKDVFELENDLDKKLYTSDYTDNTSKSNIVDTFKEKRKILLDNIIELQKQIDVSDEKEDLENELDIKIDELKDLISVKQKNYVSLLEKNTKLAPDLDVSEKYLKDKYNENMQELKKNMDDLQDKYKMSTVVNKEKIDDLQTKNEQLEMQLKKEIEDKNIKIDQLQQYQTTSNINLKLLEKLELEKKEEKESLEKEIQKNKDLEEQNKQNIVMKDDLLEKRNNLEKKLKLISDDYNSIVLNQQNLINELLKNKDKITKLTEEKNQIELDSRKKIEDANLQINQTRKNNELTTQKMKNIETKFLEKQKELEKLKETYQKNTNLLTIQARQKLDVLSKEKRALLDKQQKSDLELKRIQEELANLKKRDNNETITIDAVIAAETRQQKTLEELNELKSKLERQENNTRKEVDEAVFKNTIETETRIKEEVEAKALEAKKETDLLLEELKNAGLSIDKLKSEKLQKEQEIKEIKENIESDIKKALDSEKQEHTEELIKEREQHKEQIKQIKDEKENKESIINTLQKEKDALESTIQSKTMQTKKNKIETDKLIQTIAELEQKQSNLMDENKSLKDLSNKAQSIETQTTEVSTETPQILQTSTDVQTEDFDSLIEDVLSTKTEHLQLELEEEKSKLVELQQKHGEILKEKNDELQKSQTDNTEKINKLERESDILTNEITRQQEEINKLMTERMISEDISSQKIQELTDDNISQKQKLETIQQDLQNMTVKNTKEVQRIQEELETTKKKLEETSAENIAIQQEINSTQEQLQNKSDELNTKEIQFNELEEKLSKLQIRELKEGELEEQKEELEEYETETKIPTKESLSNLIWLNLPSLKEIDTASDGLKIFENIEGSIDRTQQVVEDGYVYDTWDLIKNNSQKIKLEEKPFDTKATDTSEFNLLMKRFHHNLNVVANKLQEPDHLFSSTQTFIEDPDNITEKYYSTKNGIFMSLEKMTSQKLFTGMDNKFKLLLEKFKNPSIEWVPDNTIGSLTENQYKNFISDTILLKMLLIQYTKLRAYISDSLKEKSDEELSNEEKDTIVKNNISLNTIFPKGTNLETLPTTLWPRLEGDFPGRLYLNHKTILQYSKLCDLSDLGYDMPSNVLSIMNAYDTFYEEIDWKSDSDAPLNKHIQLELETYNKEPGDTLTDEETYENNKLYYVLGGTINDLIDMNLIDLVDDERQVDLEKFIQNINTDFKELSDKFCINCEIDEKIQKLKEVFEIAPDIFTEQDLYDKHSITVRDLNLYVYLHIIENISNSSIKNKYKNLLIRTVENVILEHINYSIWMLMFSENYNYEEFNKNINKGKYSLQNILEFIYEKENIKFRHLDSVQKYYQEILIKYVYKIKIARDIFNMNKLKNQSLEKLLLKYKEYTYDHTYYTSIKMQKELYSSLVSVLDIKNINKCKFNNKIINLLNIINDIIFLYRNVYIFINNITLFYSATQIRNNNELKYNMRNFANYLQIDRFIKEHSVINKELKIDDTTILCRTKNDFNIYLNKLLEKINGMNNVDFIYYQWDLIEYKLKQMDIFSKFEIECIKLIAAVKYNETLLKKSNIFIRAYNSKKNKFKMYLQKLKMSYKNINKYSRNVLELPHDLSGVKLYNLLHFESQLGRLMNLP